MEELKEKILELIKKVKNAITLKNVLVLILGIIAILAGAALLIWVVAHLLNFIILNHQLLIIGGVFLAAVIYYINDARKSKERKIENETKKDEVQKGEVEKAGLERNYNLLRQVLLLTINDTVEATHLQRISSPSQLDMPVHYDGKCGFYVYQYLTTKTASMLSLDMIKAILRKRMEQKLLANEVNGISQTVYIHTSGRSYPIIYIDDIKDCGDFLQVDVVITCKAYAEYAEQAQAIKTTYSISSADKDF